MRAWGVRPDLDFPGAQERGGQLPAGAAVGVEDGGLLLGERRDGAPAHEVVPAALEARVERLHASPARVQPRVAGALRAWQPALPGARQRRRGNGAAHRAAASLYALLAHADATGVTAACHIA